MGFLTNALGMTKSPSDVGQQLNPVMEQQSQLGGTLQTMMQGGGPQPWLNQLNAATGRNIAGAQGMIASQRGINPALATRMGANIGAQANQEAANQASMQAQQGQLAATSMYGNLLGQQQQGALGQASLQQQQQAANQQAIGSVLGSLINAGGGMGASILKHAHGGEIEKPILDHMSDIRAQFKMNSGGAVSNLKQGGGVDGKAQVSGDSIKNDTVPAMLSPGEIVIPRSIAQHPDAAAKSAQFVAAVLAKKGRRV